MVQPTRRRPWPATAFVDVLILVAGVALGIYFVVEDELESWLIRLSWAGALVAGLAVVLYSVARLIDRNREPYV
jgi:ABC-type transport system involved in cytochrome c biogenesis permease subunit